MKNSYLIAALAALPLALSQAGQPMAPMSKNPTPMQPAPQYGVGNYWSLQGGINAYQNYEGTETKNIGGTSVTIEAKEKLGGFGGVKVGTVLGTGNIRGAIELDLFYNGADFDVEARGGGQKANITGRFDTGAYLANFILRGGLGKFQPYIGVGGGGWFGQIDNARFKVANGKSVKIGNDGSSSTQGSGALQAIAGADVFVSDRISIYLEYKFLNYFAMQIPGQDWVSQQLVGGGVRFFF